MANGMYIHRYLFRVSDFRLYLHLNCLYIRSNLHDACRSATDKGGSVECVEAVFSLYGDDERMQDELWCKRDVELQDPLFHAAKESNYKILQWRLTKMDEDTKASFFTSGSALCNALCSQYRTSHCVLFLSNFQLTKKGEVLLRSSWNSATLLIKTI